MYILQRRKKDMNTSNFGRLKDTRQEDKTKKHWRACLVVVLLVSLFLVLLVLVFGGIAFSRRVYNNPIETINGISPVSQTLDFTVAGSTNINVNTFENGVEIELDCSLTKRLNNTCVDYDISGQSCPFGYLGLDCFHPSPSFTTLIVNGTTTLGNQTLCNAPIDESCLNISGQSCPSGYLSSDCMYPSPSFTTLNVEGPTTLGNQTSCGAPLEASCLDISGQSCPSASLNVNCIPQTGLFLQDLTVEHLTVLNMTTTAPVETFNGTSVMTDELYLGELHCMGTSLGNVSVPQSCYDISGAMCPLGALSAGCIPNNLMVQNIQSTGTLTVNTVTCSVSAVPDNCMQPRIKTINTLSPDGALNFGITAASSSLTVTPATNGITLDVANTAVTPGSYGSGSQIPSLTVNSKGQITSISNVALASSSPVIAHQFTAVLGGAVNVNSGAAIPLTIVSGSGFTVFASGKFTMPANGYLTVQGMITNAEVNPDASSFGLIREGSAAAILKSQNVPFSASTYYTRNYPISLTVAVLAGETYWIRAWSAYPIVAVDGGDALPNAQYATGISWTLYRT
jgi:hypothetical protein